MKGWVSNAFYSTIIEGKISRFYLRVVASRRLLNRFGCMFDDLHVYGGDEL